MGGGEKGLELLGGQPLLAHVIDGLAPQASAIAISANGDPARFGQFNLPVLPDTVPGYLGPLAGLLAGMQWAARLDATYVLSMPTDTPFFPADLGASLSEALQGNAPALAASNGRRHPAVGLWPVDLAARLHDFLLSGATYKVSAFANSCNAVVVDFPMIALVRRQPRSVLQRQQPGRPGFCRNTCWRIAAMSGAVFGITGWKNSGKTTLTERLVAEFTRRGFRVSTVKHAHHDFDIDREGADSYRHRLAGAAEVAIVSGRRWALMHELRGEDEPKLDEILARLAPCDLVLVEGYKREAHPKIETRRLDAKDNAPLSAIDPNIRAVAADHAIDGETMPVFSLDDVAAIADFIAAKPACPALALKQLCRLRLFCG